MRTRSFGFGRGDRAVEEPQALPRRAPQWRRAAGIAALLTGLSLPAAAAGGTTTPGAAAGPDALAASVARGAYLAKAGDCAGCHTAADGGAPYAGGLGLTSPVGTIYSTNITPDRRDGIGGYSYADFARALREGVAPRGRRLYPAMPYTAFAKVTDDDVRALYDYFMHGVPAVPQRNRETRLPFPFNQRWLLTFWNAIYKPKGVYAPRAEHGPVWNRGAYLVQGLGHCGACHTPRGLAYQEKGHDETDSHFLVGGVNDHWFAANLTGDMGSGIGRISEAALVSFMKTGHGDGNAAYGSMVQTVEDSLQYLSDDGLFAMAHYLKSLPPRHGSGRYAPQVRPTARAPGAGNRTDDRFFDGLAVYRGFCQRCHGADGKGTPSVFPALAGNPTLLNEDTTSLIRLLVEGGNSPNTLSGPPRQQMPGFAGRLDDAALAQVLTYVRSAWGNEAQPVTANDVRTLRRALHK